MLSGSRNPPACARELVTLAISRFFGNEGPEIGRRAGKDHAAEVGELTFNLGSARPAVVSLLSLSTITRRFRGA